MQPSDIAAVGASMSALLTPLTAIAVAYVAYQQWRTNQRREERESKAARLSIYRRVKAMLRHLDSTLEIREDDYSDFCEAVAEADFLFPEPLRDWLGEVESAATQWVEFNNMILSAAPDADRASLRDLERDKERLAGVLQNAHCDLREQFAEYMK